MRHYAIVEESGAVAGSVSGDRRYIEIPGPLPEGRLMVQGHELIACPEIVLQAPEGNVVAGVEFVLVMDFDRKVYAGDVPARLIFVVNDVEKDVRPGTPFRFDEPGDYSLKVIGPWPWASNQLRMTVEAADEVF